MSHRMFLEKMIGTHNLSDDEVLIVLYWLYPEYPLTFEEKQKARRLIDEMVNRSVVTVKKENNKIILVIG